ILSAILAAALSIAALLRGFFRTCSICSAAGVVLGLIGFTHVICPFIRRHFMWVTGMADVGVDTVQAATATVSVAPILNHVPLVGVQFF
ncbi:hypothetical protein, partial [Escherichia coli]|uniref:hypothetical protein n=1 Tax=Escherichia coli TaxID=562 RepID=UPI001F4B2358